MSEGRTIGGGIMHLLDQPEHRLLRLVRGVGERADLRAEQRAQRLELRAQCVCAQPEASSHLVVALAGELVEHQAVLVDLGVHLEQHLAHLPRKAACCCGCGCGW